MKDFKISTERPGQKSWLEHLTVGKRATDSDAFESGSTQVPRLVP